MIILVAAIAIAGPWTRSLGDAYARVGVDVFLADQVMLPGSTGSADYTGTSTTLYGEVGLVKSWPVQLVVNVAPVAVHRTIFDRQDAFVDATGYATVVSPGDLRIGPQVALSKLPIAAGVELKVPLYGIDGICLGEELTDVCARPGDGQIDVTPQVLAGSSFANGAAWVEGSVGYRIRTEAFVGWTDGPSFSDGIPLAAAVGVQATRVWAQLRVDALVNVDRTTEWTAEGVKVGPGAGLRLGNGLTLESRASWDLWVHNQSLGKSLGLGLSWQPQT